MSFPKKFHHSSFKSLEISKSRILFGIITGIFFSLSFYFLTSLIREVLRIISTTENYDLWILSKRERIFYNLFYALVAAIFGQSICFSIWLNNKRKPLKRHRYLRSSILIDQSVLNTYFILWFSKLALMFALFFGADRGGGFYVFSFYPDYKYLFILIIIVLFLQTWVTIRRIFKNKSLKWMLVSFLIVFGYSFLLTNINIVDYKSINKSLLENNVFKKYDLQVPESGIWSNKIENKSLARSLYLTRNLKDSDQHTTKLIVQGKEIKFSDLDDLITAWQNYLDEIDIPRMNYILYVDKNITMKEVNKLQLKLSSRGINKIAYAVTPAIKKYDKRYYRNYIFRTRIPITRAYGTIPPPPPPVNLSEYNRVISVEIPENGVYLINGIYIDQKNLNYVFKTLIAKKRKFIVALKTKELVNFSSYFTALSAYKVALDELRNEYSQRKFFIKFDDLDEESRMQVKYRYPFAIYETFFYEPD